jgi:hypothetical protein
MPDEPIAAPAGGAGGGDGGGSSAPSVPAAPAANVSDTEFLNQPDTSTTDQAGVDAAAKTGEPKPAEPAAPEEINLSALEEGQPEWLAKVTDPAARTEVEKLLAVQKAFSDKFKDAADLDAFFKDLPGGREQVTALQTLSKEVGELDSALEANEPGGLATVAERYLSMTPDGGVNLMRAAAQHMAKASPESWNQISAELVNSTLKASGIGTDLQGIVSAIAEMRAAAQAEKWEDFGNAASKLMGQPKAEPKADANLTKLAERENAARASEQKAQTETWNFRRDARATKINTHVRTEAGKVLANVLPKSIGEKDRAKLLDDISAEVSAQVGSNAWLLSRVTALIGQRHADGKGGYTFDKINRSADQKAFDESSQLMIDAATPKIITTAVAKVVSAWSKERASTNLEARNKAKGAATRTDVGGGKPGATNTRKPISAEALRERNPDGSLKISDRDFLNL